jgi:hypothetical protein
MLILGSSGLRGLQIADAGVSKLVGIGRFLAGFESTRTALILSHSIGVKVLPIGI